MRLPELIKALAVEVDNEDDRLFDDLYGQLVARVGEPAAEAILMALSADDHAQPQSDAPDA
jgi:hypothetical protein